MRSNILTLTYFSFNMHFEEAFIKLFITQIFVFMHILQYQTFISILLFAVSTIHVRRLFFVICIKFAVVALKSK